MILLAAATSRRKAWITEILRLAGWENEFAIVRPARLAHAVSAGNPTLVLLDGRSLLIGDTVPNARICAPDCRFVLCSHTVTPALVRTALDGGLDGVLSASLPPIDAAQTLKLICRGEFRLRFEAPPRTAICQAPVEVSEFDALWMFGAPQES